MAQLDQPFVWTKIGNLTFFYTFFLNGLSSASFCLFLSFQTNIKILKTNTNVKKCPSIIRCWDLNPQHLEHESPPINHQTWAPALFLYLLNTPVYYNLLFYGHKRGLFKTKPIFKNTKIKIDFFFKVKLFIPSYLLLQQ